MARAMAQLGPWLIKTTDREGLYSLEFCKLSPAGEILESGDHRAILTEDGEISLKEDNSG